jgi:hypothetical protein
MANGVSPLIPDIFLDDKSSRMMSRKLAEI